MLSLESLSLLSDESVDEFVALCEDPLLLSSSLRCLPPLVGLSASASASASAESTASSASSVTASSASSSVTASSVAASSASASVTESSVTSSDVTASDASSMTSATIGADSNFFFSSSVALATMDGSP